MDEYDLVGFGEGIIRLMAPFGKRLEQTNVLEAYVGGPELNVCIILSRFGLKTAFISRLVNNPLGRMVANKVREHGVDTSHIVWTKEGRVALHFLELGSKPRPSRYTFDRRNTPLSEVKPGEIDWSSLLKSTRVLLVGGTPPALGKASGQAVKDAMKIAKASHCLVAFDVNYRANLWTEEEARVALIPMMEDVDILFTSIEDSERIFELTGPAEQRCETLRDRFKLKVVAITIKHVPRVWAGTWSSVVCGEDRILHSPRKHELEIVDRVGAGDNFAAGFLYGYLTGEGGQDIEKGIKYGDATAALIHTVYGCESWSTIEEVDWVVKGGEMKIQR